MNKGAKTATAGLAGAAVYLAMSAIGTRRIKLGALMAVAGVLVVNMVASVSASHKAYQTESRLTDLIQNGGSFGGDIHVVGSHYVTGDAHVSGDHYTTGQSHHGSITTNGDVTMNNHNLANLAEINTGGQTFGAHGAFYMNGHDIHMQGGSVLSDA